MSKTEDLKILKIYTGICTENSNGCLNALYNCKKLVDSS